MCSIARACQYTPSTTVAWKPRERSHVAHAIPGIQLARRLALGFVALEKPRHEELPRQRRQPHAPGLAVVDDSIGLVGIDHFDHRARRRRVIDDGVVVLADPAACARPDPSACCRTSARSRRPPAAPRRRSDGTAASSRCRRRTRRVMPIFFSETFSQSASSSLGVVNRHLMLSCARRSVSA